MKTSKLIILSLLILTPLIANAGVEHLNLPKCALAVYPYNPSSTPLYGAEGGAELNKLSEATCKSRTPYGSSYNQPPVVAENALKAGADGKNVPDAYHLHSYVDTSLQDNYYYRSFIDRFEIKLESDALGKIDLDKVQCVVPAPGSYAGDASGLLDCNGSAADLYGGTTVSFNQGTGVITWQFGTSDTSQRPQRWGNNTGLNTILSSITGSSVNLGNSNDLYRKFDPEIYLPTKNNSGEIWSATSTSRILIRNYAILKSSVNNTAPGYGNFMQYCAAAGDFTKWCPLDTPGGQGYQTVQLGSTGQQQWFWFPIGSDVSVWRKQATPPPSDVACADLKWDGAFLKKTGLGLYSPDLVHPNALLQNEAAVMKFKTIYDSGSGTKRPLEYRWVSFNGEQNRPAWFKNDDMLYGLIYTPIIIPLSTSLPVQLLKVAYAAPLGSGGVSLPSALDPIKPVEVALDAILKIGNFKDEVGDTLSGNPIVDDDFQAWFSGGSEGVTLGVQAFYTDGKNVSGQGAMINTPGGIRQKAELCHLEQKIQPPPVTCIDLTISPSTIKPNTPVTFTVTPKFSPASGSIPLNYYWQGKATSAGGIGGNLGNINPLDLGSVITKIDPNIYTLIPGAVDKSGDPTWVNKGIILGAGTGIAIEDLINPCANGGCNVIPLPKPSFDGGPVINPGIKINPGLNLNGGLGNVKDFGTTNVFGNAVKVAALPPVGGSTSLNLPPVSSITPLIPSIPSGSSLTGTDLIDKDGATMQEISYGAFKDYQGGPLFPTNPFLETNDNQTFYTGGPSGTIITVQGQGKDGTIYPACKDSLVIPALPPDSKCLILKVKFLDGATEVAKENLVAGKTYLVEIDKANSKKTDGTLISQFNIRLNNSAGPGAYGTLEPAAGNPGGCSAVTGAAGTIGTDSTSVDCKYNYTPKADDKIRIEADPTDGIAACTVEQILPTAPPSICKQLVAIFKDGPTAVTKETMVAGKTYNISIDKAASQKSDGSPITNYTLNIGNAAGGVLVVPDPTNAATCPGIVVKMGGNALLGTNAPASVDCKYNYTAKAGDQLTLAAQPTDDVALCTIKQTIPGGPAICKDLNLITSLGSSNEFGLNQTITLLASPKDTLGAAREPVVYTEESDGKFVASPGNAPACPAVPADTTAKVEFAAPSSCKYSFFSPTGLPASGKRHFTVKVQKDDGVPACTKPFELKVAPPAICKDLNLITSLGSSNEFGLNQTITLLASPKDTLGAAREPVVYTEESDGKFVASPGNAPACPAVPADTTAKVEFAAPSSCKYSFFSPTGLPASGKRHFTVKVQKDDGVAACTKPFELKATPVTPEKCLALNLQVNGAYTLSPLLTPGTSYSLQASPITTKGNPVLNLYWTEYGAGKLVGQPSNPLGCKPIIDNESAQTFSFCRYIYAGGVAASDGFSVKAVTTDVPENPNCQAVSSSFVKPPENPFCLYLDLSYNPAPYNGTNADLTSVVVMSDGSKYKGNVRFVSSDGSGQFNGGFAPTLNAGSSNFRSATNPTNSTTPVNYTGGSGTTAINIFLADTDIKQSAACQRQLTPVKKPTYKCEIPPKIVREGNKFTATLGNSDQYCWTISGTGNVFTNGLKTATGKSVLINADYANFNLRVEDCNPAFKSFCSDDYVKESTPKITKSIAKATGTFGTKINYSTKKSSYTENIKYKLTFTPSNYSSGNMTATVYDPAFSGTINGHKPLTDDKGNLISQNGGDIKVNLSSIIVNDETAKTYGLCPINGPSVDSCYEILPLSKYPNFGALIIHGIQSTKVISITYNATLTSSITIDDCQKGKACNEQFINQSLVSDMQYCTATVDGSGKTIINCTPPETLVAPQCQEITYYDATGKALKLNPCDKMTITSNVTTAEGVCQYFLTRASGDVFLEDELKHGIDVSKCYPFKNVSSTIVKPVKPIDGKLIKTGTPTVVNIGHEICSAGQSNFNTTSYSAEVKASLAELFGANLTSLSSQICEVGLVPGSDWDKESIRATIDQNIGKLTRWSSDIKPSTTIDNFTQLKSQSLGGVYYYEGSGSETVTISSLDIPEGQGAHTIIVKNADLQINGNINYTADVVATEPKNISSLGVIVLGGNMYIDTNVSTLSGAYFVQRNTDAPTTGNIFSGKPGYTDDQKVSTQPLTVYGSIYGNIGPLFENRTGAGDVTQDAGAITIRYDQRIIQNPPQGLSEILGSFSQSQVAQ